MTQHIFRVAFWLVTQKWVTNKLSCIWWLKVSHQKWVTIAYCKSWRSDDIKFRGVGHGRGQCFILRVWNYDFWIRRIEFGTWHEFQSKRTIFEFFIFGRSFWTALLIFDFWDQDFWIPRIVFGVRTHFQSNRTMFNFSSSDVLFEQPFSFLVSGTKIFEFLVSFLVLVPIFSLIEQLLIFSSPSIFDLPLAERIDFWYSG